MPLTAPASLCPACQSASTEVPCAPCRADGYVVCPGCGDVVNLATGCAACPASKQAASDARQREGEEKMTGIQEYSKTDAAADATRAAEAVRADEARLARLAAKVAILKAGLAAVEGLIGQSKGVYGLHLNGDPSPWEELRTGGVYEEWLLEFDAALAVTD